MRALRIPPLRLRRGFLMGAFVLLIAAPNLAASTSTVDVTLRLSAAEPVTSLQLKVCELTVAAGADGIAVLDEAMDAGCIASYETQAYPGFGNFVRCIDDLCGAPDEALNVTYWRMTHDGQLTSYGVDDFASEEGDELGFSYATWASCETPFGC